MKRLIVAFYLVASLMTVAAASGFMSVAAADMGQAKNNQPVTVYIIRHGETDWNREGRLQGDTDNSLNEAGRSQARDMARQLAGVNVDHIYPSGLARAIETAEVFRARAPMTPMPLLNERSRGMYEGKVADEVADEFRPRFHDLDDDMDGGESLRSIADRVSLATREIVAAHPGGTVMIVGHSGVNPLVIAELAGIPPEQAIADISQSNDEVFKVQAYPNDTVSMWKMVTRDRLEDF